MANKVLLVCSDPSISSVSAGAHHSYAVEGGFCVVDVDRHVVNDSTADAAKDALEICAMHTIRLTGDFHQPVMLFRPANADEIQGWTAKDKPVSVEPKPQHLETNAWTSPGADRTDELPNATRAHAWASHDQPTVVADPANPVVAAEPEVKGFEWNPPVELTQSERDARATMTPDQLAEDDRVRRDRVKTGL